ncbi:MAG TPA: SCO family protein [Opitutus sp.]|nr:SCO family protein [Opitutus sp.]
MQPNKSGGRRAACARGRAALVAASVLLLAGCARKKPSTRAPDGTRYPLQGEVVSVDTKRNVMVVHHEALEGLMPAMTMEFAVSPGDAANAKPGEHIRAQLVPQKTGDWRLEEIWPDDRATDEAVAAQAKRLHEDTASRGQGAYREIGETIPKFALYDQDGRVVDSARFRGRQLMLNFIYTRCPVANMCPAATLKMMQTQKLARQAGVKDLELVSITLDPTYDTPGVLKDYAAVRGIDTSNFSFLTGPQSAIKDLLTQFGVIAEFQGGGFLQHTLATLLIDGHGRIIHRADGSQWEPKEFVAHMHKT